jgi:two-component system, OmpR family, response regulator
MMRSARSAGVCEDDDALRGVLRSALERDGLTVRGTASGTEALRAFGASPPDVLVLDIALPDADGRDLCQALRARGVASPVLFLTARDALPDRISGFHAGGDDYLTKPFALAELLVRVHALLRRADGNGGAEPRPSVADGVALDPAGHAVAAGAESMRLTPTEFRLLAALAGRRGAVLRRAELVAAAWPAGAMVHDNTLDAYIARIRRKLRELGAPDAVETVRGVGYVLR